MFKVILTIFISCVFACNAIAGSSNGVVSQILVQDVYVMFVAGDHAAKPACSTQGEAWAFNSSTPGGKAMYALLLSANAQGKTVNVLGSGNCNDWGDREMPTYIVMNN